MNDLFWGTLSTPIGLIEIGGTSDAVTSLLFVEQQRPDMASNAVVERALAQVSEYFSGARRTFDLDLDLHGTEFQRLVWQRLLTVPYGQTTSYQALAEAIGRPKAVRAVGAANGQNPVALIVPCHRVIGSDGRLVGYGGGLWRKEWLLKHEGAILV